MKRSADDFLNHFDIPNTPITSARLTTDRETHHFARDSTTLVELKRLTDRNLRLVAHLIPRSLLFPYDENGSKEPSEPCSEHHTTGLRFSLRLCYFA